jgi:nucleotide-binding universal stress UspA family protein
VVVLVIIESLERFGIQNQLTNTAGWQKQKELLRRHLDRAADQLTAVTPNVKSVFREVPHAAQAIIETAADSRSDLIVVGSTGKTGWERLLLGSVSRHVLHHAPCSVWVERASAINVAGAKAARP